MIMNFVSNSIKFTHQGHIDIILYEISNTIKIEVKDTGEGMKDDVKKNLF